jgi:cell wall-associated NlpC family hydrolase
MRARAGGHQPGIRRAAAAGIGLAGLLAAAALVGYGGAAGAAPQPSLAQVRQQVNSLQANVDATGQQYDQVVQQLSAARGRLSQAQRAAAAAQARFLAARATLAQTAAAAYENHGQNSAAGILTSGDPAAILQQASLLLQMAGNQDGQTREFLADTQQLAGVQQQLQHTEYGIATLRTQLAARKNTLGKLLASKQATLDSLTIPQQAAVTAAGVGAGGTTTGPPYTGPTSTQAEKAVAFAYAQLGKPYQWGATGPGSYDCSGLAQAAWASAGVAIPRDTYQQFAALPHIALSAIQPGDLLYYEGVGHVAMYVGNGYVIDAPQTGSFVQKLPMGTSWYVATFVGAVRP